ncbi:hypothetical protein [Spirosoma koreense]
MMLQATTPLPGFYQYTYPTFADRPQQLCIHFLTPDGQSAFVTYPRHPNYKAAQLVPISWFQSIVLEKLDGQPQLMSFLEETLSRWFTDRCFKFMPEDLLTSESIGCSDDSRMAA